MEKRKKERLRPRNIPEGARGGQGKVIGRSIADKKKENRLNPEERTVRGDFSTSAHSKQKKKTKEGYIWKRGEKVRT